MSEEYDQKRNALTREGELFEDFAFKILCQHFGFITVRYKHDWSLGDSQTCKR